MGDTPFFKIGRESSSGDAGLAGNPGLALSAAIAGGVTLPQHGGTLIAGVLELAALQAAAAPSGGADIMEVNTEKSMELRKMVRQFAQNNPEIAAQMVKSWLKGENDDG